MGISKTVRKKKLKDIKKRLSDISDLLQNISGEDERYLETATEEEIQKKLAYAADNIGSAALAVQSAILLLEAVSEIE